MLLWSSLNCTPKWPSDILVVSTSGPVGGDLTVTRSQIEFPQDSVSTICNNTSVSACFETKPQSWCYVFSIDGFSCMVTTVDPLLVLNCSTWFPSALVSSALGSRKLFSEAGFELVMLPDTELIPTGVSGRLLWTVDWDIFGRGFELLLVPRSLDSRVRLNKKQTKTLRRQIYRFFFLYCDSCNNSIIIAVIYLAVFCLFTVVAIWIK